MTLPYEGINTPFHSISEEANNSRPKCKCSTPEHPLFFNHVEDLNGVYRWVCSGCARSIKDTEIQHTADNLNAQFPGQLSPEALERQRQEQQEEEQEEQQGRAKQFANSSTAARPRITTERGATNYSTSVPPGGSFDDSNHSVFQSFDPRENYIRQSRGYSERSRTPDKTIPIQ